MLKQKCHPKNRKDGLVTTSGHQQCALHLFGYHVMDLTLKFVKFGMLEECLILKTLMNKGGMVDIGHQNKCMDTHNLFILNFIF